MSIAILLITSDVSRCMRDEEGKPANEQSRQDGKQWDGHSIVDRIDITVE